MTSRVKTKENKSGEVIAYSELAIRNNASAVEYCRTSMAALSGSTAGRVTSRGFLLDEEINRLPTLLCRYPWPDRYPGIHILFPVRDQPLGHDCSQIRIELEKVFHKPTEPVDDGIPCRTVYLCAILDIPLRHGPRVLN